MEQKRAEILQKIKQLAVNRKVLTSEQARQITEQTKIDEFSDLLDALELEMEIEKYYGISITSADVVKTYGDWVDLVAARSKWPEKGCD